MIPIVKELLDRYDKAKAIRSSSESVLNLCGKYAWPAYKDMFSTVNDDNGLQIETLDIYDSTAVVAASRMTSGLFSFNMPVGTKWFDFIASATELNDDDEIALWLAKATEITHTEIWRSNFMREMYMTIHSMVVFGTGVISVHKNKKGDIVFRAYHIADIFFEENSDGKIDVVYRRFKYTARQANQEFGDNAGKSVARAVKAGKLDEKFEFVHAVVPNTDYDSGMIDSKKFTAKFINVKDQVEVKEEGFDDMPYLIARFDRAPNEILGRSPVMDLLPEIKMLNRMRYTFISSSELAGNPPMMMEDDGVVGQPVTSPNGAIYVRAGAQYPQPYKTGVNPALNGELIAQQQQLVRDGLFNSLFQSLQGLRNMTATEAEIRKSDDMNMLAPTTGSIQKELYDPLLSRVVNLLPDKKLPPAPIKLDYDIVYQGRLALAMNNMQTSATETALAIWTPLMQVTPILDNISLDKAFRASLLSRGTSADTLVPMEQVIAMREQRNQEAQQQQEVLAAESLSKSIKNVSGSVAPDSIAAEVMG